MADKFKDRHSQEVRGSKHRGFKGKRNDKPFSNRDRNSERKPNNHSKDRGKPSERNSSLEKAPTIYGDTPKGIAVRRVACDLLALVRDGMSLDEALSQGRSYQGLARNEHGEKEPATVRADKGFARAMATTVLRRKGTLDHLIGPYLNRPLPARAKRIMDILRVSAAQTLFLETPHHAAVSLATELAKERQELGGYANLVNAVSRKLANTPKEKIADLPLRTDTPAWMWRGWERAYGAANARKIAIAHQKKAPLDMSFINEEAMNELAQTLDVQDFSFNAGLNSLRMNPAPSNVTKLEGFQDGKFWIQDVSASLPVALLGNLDGKTVLDLCAAPGGKTLQLAAAGAKVIALDRSDERLDRLRANLARTKLEADIVVSDAMDYQPHEKTDIVLLDAPCTATGTIRRHPDIPWSKTQDDVEGLVSLQAKLLDHAITMVKPGGMLVYCTCSLQPEEGEKQINAALKRHEHISRVSFATTRDPVLDGPFEEAITRHGDLRVLPFMGAAEGGMDGFFISRLKKES